MKTSAKLIGFAGQELQDLTAALGPDFETEVMSPAALASGNLSGVVCLVHASAVQEIGPHLAAASAGGARLFALLDSTAAEGRLALLRAGFSDVFTAPWQTEEIRLKATRAAEDLTRQRNAVHLNGQIQKLSQYFSNDVVQKILSQTGENHSYGEMLEATVFFLDVRNFTALSEKITPTQVAELLNRLYTDIMDLVLSYKGSVNKIIGDALLATFGCPVRGEKDARNAVECALAIRDTLRFFNDTKPSYLTTDISIGMGIATGPVFAGTIGSYRKMDYTVIGDTVNVASRLETLTKQTRFDLIIDSKTRELAGPDLMVKKLQVTRVRGRTKPMDIFLVEGFQDVAKPGSGDVFFADPGS
ncbi:MAG: adenylate/guanylate cyclase domain-containing protein [Spirochaetota bacterium]